MIRKGGEEMSSDSNHNYYEPKICPSCRKPKPNKSYDLFEKFHSNDDHPSNMFGDKDSVNHLIFLLSTLIEKLDNDNHKKHHNKDKNDWWKHENTIENHYYYDCKCKKHHDKHEHDCCKHDYKCDNHHDCKCKKHSDKHEHDWWKHDYKSDKHHDCKCKKRHDKHEHDWWKHDYKSDKHHDCKCKKRHDKHEHDWWKHDDKEDYDWIKYDDKFEKHHKKHDCHCKKECPKCIKLLALESSSMVMHKQDSGIPEKIWLPDQLALLFKNNLLNLDHLFNQLNKDKNKYTHHKGNHAIKFSETPNCHCRKGKDWDKEYEEKKCKCITKKYYYKGMPLKKFKRSVAQYKKLM